MAKLHAFVRPLPTRLARFVTVGALGTVLDVGLFTVLRGLVGIPAVPANVLSYSAGIVNNYLLHRSWTFGDAPRKLVPLQFAQFGTVAISALALNTGLVALLVGPLGGLAGSETVGDLLAKVVATVSGVAWSFAAQSAWTFRATGKGASL
ncbi:MAG: GtrA family protein [Dehalococcoidia bacterium]